MNVFLKGLIVTVFIEIACAEDRKIEKRHYPFNIFNANPVSSAEQFVIPKSVLRGFTAPMIGVLLKMIGSSSFNSLPPVAKIFITIGLALGTCALSPICRVALTDPGRLTAEDVVGLLQKYAMPQDTSQLVAQNVARLLQKYVTPQNIRQITKFGVNTVQRIVG